MKIVSWNLNGMRAAFRHGLSEFLTSCDADIFCFQETKLSEPTALANKAGFRAYWTFNEQRRGYSGTLVLTRHLPLHMQSTLPDPNLDSEARVQTLEFANFYLVNAYFPRSLGSEGRRDYRRKFDEAVLEHLQTLAKTKAVILCGDFNATMTDDDFYAENTWQEKNAQGFLPEEREGLHAIVAAGFVDAYRQIHPTERERYSWWSPRLYKRRENRGWRLDHFFVHESIAHKIEECTMLTHVYGSDHCPVVLEIDVDPGTVAVNSDAVEVQRETYRRTSLLASDESILFQLSAGDLGAMWQKINWSQTEERLLELQRALSHAAYSKNKARIRACQRKITSNFEARLLAVRHVCTMAGGPGVDGVQWKTPEAKMLAALTLNQGDYHALPSRLLIIQCRKEKSRHIHVETFYDRAMQALYSYALDPVAEAWADKRSFSYRKGRGSYDMNEHIIRIFSGPGAPAWVLIGDISKCYQNISHQWVLENIPLPRKILREFLEAGFVFSGELFPTGSGVGIGCALSPIIANMTLDGMQAHLDSVAPSATLVRYADDVLVAAASRTQAQTAQAALGTFLALRGLELSANKTQIVPVVSGFEFCARSYLLRGEQMYAKPSQDSIERFMGSLRETILGWSGSQQNLIKKLNRKIDGWVTYHKTTDALDAFRAIDVYISALLLQLCQAKHPKWRRSKIVDRYFFRDEEGRWRYSLPNKRELCVKFLSDALFYPYEPVKLNVNPYLDQDYLTERKKQQKERSAVGINRSIWRRQSGRCWYCGQRILRDDSKSLIEIVPPARKKTHSLAYVHTRCMDNSIEVVESDTDMACANDLRELLEQLLVDETPHKSKYFGLAEWFSRQGAPFVALSFAEIESLMGRPLPKTARLRREWWYRTGMRSISQCWLACGYEISSLKLGGGTTAKTRGDGRVGFKLTYEGKQEGNVQIPDALRYRRVPMQAKYELENYFAYILHKYNL